MNERHVRLYWNIPFHRDHCVNNCFYHIISSVCIYTVFAEADVVLMYKMPRVDSTRSLFQLSVLSMFLYIILNDLFLMSSILN